MFTIAQEETVKALGISFRDERSWLRIADEVRDNHTKLFAHCLLTEDLIEDWIARASWWPCWLDGVIFLMFKPHGRGFECSAKPLRKQQFDRLFTEYKKCEINIGFDSCCYHFLKDKVSANILENCDGGFYSMYYDAVKMVAASCSFLPPFMNLVNPDLQEVWDQMNRITSCKYQPEK